MLELACPGDLKEVNRLAREVHEMHISWRPDIYTMPEELYPAERFQAAVQARELYVAKEGGQVCGYVAVRIRETAAPGLVPRRVMLVDELCVDEPFRNQGIGSQMMAEVRILARAFRCTDLQLGVYPQNDEAVAFYQKCGFMIQSITMQRKV